MATPTHTLARTRLIHTARARTKPPRPGPRPQLNERIQQHKATFVKPCLDVLHQKVTTPERTVPLHVDTAALFLRTLAAHQAQLTPELAEQFRQIQAGYLQSYPKMSSLIAGADQPGTGSGAHGAAGWGSRRVDVTRHLGQRWPRRP